MWARPAGPDHQRIVAPRDRPGKPAALPSLVRRMAGAAIDPCRSDDCAPKPAEVSFSGSKIRGRRPALSQVLARGPSPFSRRPACSQVGIFETLAGLEMQRQAAQAR